MDSVENVKKPRYFLILPVFPAGSPFQYSKKIREIWQKLHTDDDLDEKPSLEEVAAKYNEVPNQRVRKVGLNRDLFFQLASFEESPDHPGCVDMDFCDFNILVKMKIEKLNHVLTEFLNEVPFQGEEVQPVDATK